MMQISQRIQTLSIKAVVIAGLASALMVVEGVPFTPFTAEASEFRSSRPIRTERRTEPGLRGVAPNDPGAQEKYPGVPFGAVSRADVERAVRDIVATWNTPDFSQKLAENFRGASRLMDTLSELPHDAKLEVVALKSVQTLSQDVQDVSANEVVLVSRVLVQVETRTTRSASANAASTANGTSELIVQIHQRYRR